VISAIEHPSILKPCAALERSGIRVTKIPVDGHGIVDPDDIGKAIETDTVLVSIMHANNEIGAIQPLSAVSAETRRRGVVLHTDAAQSLGKVPFNVDHLGVDLATVAGHKLHAPKGVGALYVRSGTLIDPLIRGGGHEGGQRAGTESVLLIAGLGAAAALAKSSPCHAHLKSASHHLWQKLQTAFAERVVRLGHPQHCLPNTVCVGFVGKSGAAILAGAPELAASTGSACDTGNASMSHVLTAMGIESEVGLGAVRFSVGRYTTKAEIDRAVALVQASYDQT
jgi:cysteine desulfurase